MMTLKEWRRRDDLRLGLAELLKNDVLLSAIEVCLSQEIDIPPGRAAGDDLIHAQALEGAKREGYFRFLRNFKLLAEIPVDPPPHLAPWADKSSVTSPKR